KQNEPDSHHHSRSQTQEAAAAPSSNRSLQWFPRLLAVADAIDRTGPVVGDEDRAILGKDDVIGAAEIALVALDPAGGEDLRLRTLAVRPDDDALDPRALVLVPVPGAVLGDQDVVLVVRRELAAGIELHAERGDMGTEIDDRRRELRAL